MREAETNEKLSQCWETRLAALKKARNIPEYADAYDYLVSRSKPDSKEELYRFISSTNRLSSGRAWQDVWQHAISTLLVLVLSLALGFVGIFQEDKALPILQGFLLMFCVWTSIEIYRRSSYEMRKLAMISRFLDHVVDEVDPVPKDEPFNRNKYDDEIPF